MADKKDNPYKNYTIEEVMAVEANYFTISLGDDFFMYNNKMAFNKERVESFYDQVVDGLRDIIENGNSEEIEDATFCLHNIKILPLRIH